MRRIEGTAAEGKVTSSISGIHLRADQPNSAGGILLTWICAPRGDIRVPKLR